MTLGLILPATIPAALPGYIAYVSALGGLAALIFGAHVSQKALTKDVYLKELEMNSNKDKVVEDDNLGGTF